MCVRKISAQCVLQFTPSLAAGCVLHRPVSRVIHCSELFYFSRPGRDFSLSGLVSKREVRGTFPPPGGGGGGGGMHSRKSPGRPFRQVRDDGSSEPRGGDTGSGGPTRREAPSRESSSSLAPPPGGGGTPFRRPKRRGTGTPCVPRDASCVRVVRVRTLYLRRGRVVRPAPLVGRVGRSVTASSLLEE